MLCTLSTSAVAENAAFVVAMATSMSCRRKVDGTWPPGQQGAVGVLYLLAPR